MQMKHAHVFCIACIYASYDSLKVLKQVTGDNTQALDLSEQTHQILTRMTTDF